MFRRALTALSLCLVCLASGVLAQSAKKPGPTQNTRVVEPSTIYEYQLATYDKYRGTVVASPVSRKTTSATAKARRNQEESLRSEMSNSFVVGAGYLYQSVDKLPVDHIHGVSAGGFYYPVSWVGFGAEYLWGRGSRTSTSGGVTRENELNRHALVLGPEFSGYPGENVRLFFHPMAGWARETLTTRTGNTEAKITGTNLAMQLGGGVDVRLNRTFAWRVVQFDYLGVRRDNSWQHNYRLATGLSVRAH